MPNWKKRRRSCMKQLNPDASGRNLLLVSLLLLCGLSTIVLMTRTLIPVDETRYVSVAWEMWLRGDFLVPFKNGEPYSHKPPFLFWMIHLGWMLFGVNDVSPRLVMPLFSAGALWLAYRLAGQLWPGHPGLGGRAALVLMASFLWIVFSTATMFDVLLAFWVLTGMHGVVRAADGQRFGFVLLGAAIGMGVLTKGPVILLNLLPVALLAPWWNPGMVSRPHWGRWYTGLGLSVMLGAGIALVWAIPAGFAGGEAYRNAIFWGQTADRMVDSVAHPRPFWWYLPVLPILLFPWFVWGGFWQAIARHRRAGLDRGLRFCLAWMLPVFLAFSFISGKQPHYLVPLLPAFALLTARVLTDHPGTRVALPALLVAGLGGALIAVASGKFVSLNAQMVALPPLWPGILLVCLAGGAWLAGRMGGPALASLSAMGVGMFALAQFATTQAIGPMYDIKPIALAIRQVQQAGHPVGNMSKYHAQYQFPGRLEVPLTELRGMETMPWLAAHPNGYLVLYLRDGRGLDAINARHWQRYRGGVVVLLDNRTAADVLAAGTVR